VSGGAELTVQSLQAASQSMLSEFALYPMAILCLSTAHETQDLLHTAADFCEHWPTHSINWNWSSSPEHAKTTSDLYQGNTSSSVHAHLGKDGILLDTQRDRPATNTHLSLYSIGPAVQADSSQAAAHPYWLAASPQAEQLPAMGHREGAELDPAEGEQGLFGIGQCWWGRPTAPQKGQMMSQTPDCPLGNVLPFHPVQAGKHLLSS